MASREADAVKVNTGTKGARMEVVATKANGKTTHREHDIGNLDISVGV